MKFRIEAESVASMEELTYSMRRCRLHPHRPMRLVARQVPCISRSLELDSPRVTVFAPGGLETVNQFRPQHNTKVRSTTRTSNMTFGCIALAGVLTVAAPTANAAEKLSDILREAKWDGIVGTWVDTSRTLHRETAKRRSSYSYRL